MGMNRAISLGFLLLLTVSFVSDGVGAAEPVGTGEADNEAYKKARSDLDEYLRTLPDHIKVLGSEASYSYTDKVGTEYNFILLSKPSTDWALVPTKIHSSTRMERVRLSGHDEVDDVFSFKITSKKAGTETMKLEQWGSDGNDLTGKDLIITAVFNAAQVAENVKRLKALRALPANYYHLIWSTDTIRISVGRVVYFLVDNRETTDEGTPTGLTWTTDGSSPGLRISQKTTKWDTAVNGMPKLYSFEVSPTQSGILTFEAKQMQGSETIATKTVTVDVK